MRPSWSALSPSIVIESNSSEGVLTNMRAALIDLTTLSKRSLLVTNSDGARPYGPVTAFPRRGNRISSVTKTDKIMACIVMMNDETIWRVSDGERVGCLV